MKPLTHEERLELIHRPFFIVNMGPSYPWGGVAVADNFYGTGEWAEQQPGRGLVGVLNHSLSTGPESWDAQSRPPAEHPSKVKDIINRTETRQLLHTDLTHDELADMLDVSVDTVRRARRRLGIERRPGRRPRA